MVDPTTLSLHLGVSLLLSAFLSWSGYRKRSLDASGAVAAFVVGLLTTLAGFRFAAVLVLFFLSSSLFTKLGSKGKRKIDAEFREGGQRDWTQVVRR